ncbi:hypothetical protein ACQY0O_004866 [Thecaphora frezii]
MTTAHYIHHALRQVGLRVDHDLTPLSAAFLVLAGLGALSSATFLLRFVKVFLDCYLLPGLPLTRFGANAKQRTRSSWAIVTGATDGIGREFALQLAKAGFHILLVSRSADKLATVARDIQAAYAGVETRTQVVDFASGDEKQYAALAETVAQIEVGVLVNNVGKSHDMPVEFAETPIEEMREIVEINVVATLKVSRIVIPQLVERKRGLVLNVGSFAGQVTTPLLATYAGSKAFLIGWSQALGEELAHHNVQVSLLNTYFVTSKLSKIKRSSAMIPTPKRYVAQVLAKVGRQGGAVCRPYTSTTYPGHALVDWATSLLLPRWWLLRFTYGQQVETRKRALRKAQKAQ